MKLLVNQSTGAPQLYATRETLSGESTTTPAPTPSNTPKIRGGHVEQIKHQRHRQQSPGPSLGHAKQGGECRPAVNAEAAHADRSGRTFDHKTPRRVLVAQTREKTADQQREKRMAAPQERCRQRGQGQRKHAQRKLYFQQVIASLAVLARPANSNPKRLAVFHQSGASLMACSGYLYG
jgi:hypothetical protein